MRALTDDEVITVIEVGIMIFDEVAITVEIGIETETAATIKIGIVATTPVATTLIEMTTEGVHRDLTVIPTTKQVANPVPPLIRMNPKKRKASKYLQVILAIRLRLLTLASGSLRDQVLNLLPTLLQLASQHRLPCLLRR